MGQFQHRQNRLNSSKNVINYVLDSDIAAVLVVIDQKKNLKNGADTKINQ